MRVIVKLHFHIYYFEKEKAFVVQLIQAERRSELGHKGLQALDDN